MNNFTHVNLPNPGITLSNLPNDIFLHIMKEISDIIQDAKRSEECKYNSSLAGNIEQQYYLNNSYHVAKPFLEEMANEYSKYWNYMPKEEGYELQSLWANLQKKYEFNPLHSHNSSISFVCWLQIPYSIHDEITRPHVIQSRAKAASIFQFVYNNIFGRIEHEDFYVDNDWSGRIVMFPAALCHQVYPFYTSDDFRISISGNLA